MRIAASLIALAALAGPAVAESRHDSSAPIDFAADHIELQDKANRAILSGNVRITQAEMVLTAARVTVAYSGKVTDGSPRASRIDASGGVTVTRPDQRASGSYGVYDVDRRTVIMLGGVRLSQGANNINGSRLTINLDTGKAVVDGGGTVSSGAGGTTASGGRVTGRFSVPKRN